MHASLGRQRARQHEASFAQVERLTARSVSAGPATATAVEAVVAVVEAVAVVEGVEAVATVVTVFTVV